jgi:hypothetical protein
MYEFRVLIEWTIIVNLKLYAQNFHPVKPRFHPFITHIDGF